MRLLSHAASSALLALALVPAPAAAQSDSSATNGFSLYVEARLVSRYVWRGYDDSRNTPSLQPYTEIGLPFGFTANAFTTSAFDRHHDLDEVQLGLGYTLDAGRGWEIGAGYLQYVLPGTETEPSPGLDPFATTRSGEIYFSATRKWDSGRATLTFSRGNNAGKGNSLNLWVEQDYAWGNERWEAQPYLQMDYLDEYGAPTGFENRLSMIEIGVPFLFRVGPVKLLAAAQVSFIPSRYVRESNRLAGAGGDVALPWFTLGLVYEPD